MVFVEIPEVAVDPLRDWLRERGIVVTARCHMRLVTHLDVTRTDIERVVDACKDFFAGSQQAYGKAAGA
jgi:threonine aldolase